MTKMSKVQQTAILDAHRNFGRVANVAAVTLRAMRRNGHTIAADERNVSRAGLIAAGVDMDALHAEAKDEDKSIMHHPAFARAQEIGAAERQRTAAQAVAVDNLAEGEESYPYVPGHPLADREPITPAERQRTAARAVPIDNRDEIGAPRTQRFHQLFKITRSWPATLDILHAEAESEHRARTAVANGTARRAFEVERSMPSVRSAEPQPAPSLADDVATLRTLTSATTAPDGEAYAARNRAMAALDRIAAQVPQRATGPDGAPFWLHSCGRVYAIQEHPAADACENCWAARTDGEWQALYVLTPTVALH